MSILLIFCVLVAAAWLLRSVIARDPADRPSDSVAAYTRAMEALDPEVAAGPAAARSSAPRTRSGARRPAARRRPSARHAAVQR